MEQKIKLTVNGKEIEAVRDETILTVLKREGIEIPTLCHIEGLSPTGACRVCLVELADSGTLVPGCSHLIAEGMSILTNSPKAITARKTIIELILADHPDDCLYCIRQGNCELSKLAQQYGVRQKVRKQIDRNSHLDITNPALIRDPAKCILCGRCVRVCEEIQGVAAIDFTKRGSNTEIACACYENLNTSRCINCGQCITVCPTGALTENNQIDEVIAVLNDPEKIVVFQHAPAISVTIAEEFGLRAGLDCAEYLNSALRMLGGQYVFDTSFSADLTIMEEASELVKRIQEGGTLPMFTSCSPGWIKFTEQFYPEFLPNLSTCKSPQQMLGAMIKSYFAEKNGLDPEKIHIVSIMPCTAKKFEALRPEHISEGIADIDTVLTTRELCRLLKLYSIDLTRCEPSAADNPFGTRSSAGKLFGATGGVMEAALRTAYHLLTGQELEELRIKPLRGLSGVKEASLTIAGLQLNVVVVNGLQNAANLLEEIKKGTRKVDFVEVMTCPGGCINGGGQPIGSDEKVLKERLQALYLIDRDDQMRLSHKNEAVLTLYKEFLGEPLGEKSHHLLHTKYIRREVL